MKLLISLLLVFLSYTFIYSQKNEQIDTVIIPKKIMFSGSNLLLNGVGVRTKLWSDIYTQALYLTNLSSNASEIINSNTKMGMVFHITSKLVTSKRFSDNLNNSIKKTQGDQKWRELQPQLNLLAQTIKAEKIVENDVFNLIYNDVDTSLWIIKNGIVKKKIAGFEFKKVFFGIWLSDKPVKEALKKQLLSNKPTT